MVDELGQVVQYGIQDQPTVVACGSVVIQGGPGKLVEQINGDGRIRNVSELLEESFPLARFGPTLHQFKIGQYRVLLVGAVVVHHQQNILRFDIEMYESCTVQDVDGFQDVFHPLFCCCWCDDRRFFPRQHVLQRRRR